MPRQASDGRTNIPALPRVHADQELGGGFVLDTLSHDGETELLAEPDRRADDGSVFGIGQQIKHERAVDLEPVEWKLPEIAQARVTGTEIIEQDPHAELLNALEDGEHATFVMEQDVFGDFDFEK